MKKIFSLLLAVVMAFSAFSVISFAETVDTAIVDTATMDTATADNAATTVNTTIAVPKDATVNFFQKVKIKCVVFNLNAGNYLAIYSDNKLLKKTAEPSPVYTSEELGSTTVFTVKVIDAKGNTVKNSSGAEIKKDITVKVNNGFFARFKAFFNLLFGGKAVTELNVSLNKEQYKATCTAYTAEALTRDPNKYKGCQAKYSGEVLQVIESTGKNRPSEYRIMDYDTFDAIYVTCYDYGKTPKIIEGDYVTIYGEFKGMYTYNTILNIKVTVPHIEAKYMEISKY